MSKAAHIVDRLLESDPDDVDPKDALMDTEPEMRRWLERNGFVYDGESGAYQKDIDEKGCDVFPPVLFTDEEPFWTVNFTFEVRSHVNVPATEARAILIRYGFAQ